MGSLTVLSNLLEKITVFAALFKIDVELAAAHQKKGCPRCGGPLHDGGYDRKPRGELCDVPSRYLRRRSFCCSGCRRRSLSPSTLFWERRVYWGPAMILAASSRQGTPALSYAYLRQRLGASASTVRRWLSYFKDTFPAGVRWQSRRGYVRADVADGALPVGLLAHFSRDRASDAGLVATLRFLAA
jgi:hypothetical protein